MSDVASKAKFETMLRASLLTLISFASGVVIAGYTIEVARGTHQERSAYILVIPVLDQACAGSWTPKALGVRASILHVTYGGVSKMVRLKDGGSRNPVQ